MDGGPGSRRATTLAILVALIVAAFEGTVVTTAMPRAVAALGDASLYSWVFVAFLVASTSGVLVCGRLADVFGRRVVFLGTVALFALGSIACAGAWSIPSLVVFRFLQGLGAGAVHPVAMTITSDLYSLEERARIQGLLTSVWGAANVAGPLVGSALAERGSFRVVFLVAVPFALLSAAILAASHRDPPRAADSEGASGATGAGLLGIGVALALVAAEPEAGRAIGDAGRLASAALAAGAFVAFVALERRARAPLLPRDLLPDPTVRAAFVGTIAGGGLLFGATTYVPWWLVHEAGRSTRDGATALIGLLLGWAFGSTAGVRVYVRAGLRTSAGGGLFLAAIGIAATALLAARGRPELVPFTLFVTGVGVGPANSTALVAAQTRTPFRHRGMLTSAIFGTRTLGGAVVVAALGKGDAWPGPRRLVALAVIAAAGALAMRILPPRAPAPVVSG